MDKPLPYFRLYTDTLQAILDKVSDEEAGLLLRAITAYHMGDVMPVMNGSIDMAFGILCAQFERDAEAYTSKCEKSASAARKRWGQKVEQPPTAPAAKPDTNRSKPCTHADYDWVDPAYRDTFAEWCRYRIDIGKSFRAEQYVRRNYNQLVQMSSGSPEMAKRIVSQSINNGYQGLFRIKDGTADLTTTYQRRTLAEQQLGNDLAQQCAEQLAAEDTRQDSFVPRALPNRR